jgi:hypothetical protein
VSPWAKRLGRLEITYLARESEAFGTWLSGLSAPQRIAFCTRIMCDLARVDLALPLPDHLWDAPVSMKKAYLASLAQMMGRDRLAVRQIIRQTWRSSAAGRLQ